jgi:hypothetical protein
MIAALTGLMVDCRKQTLIRMTGIVTEACSDSKEGFLIHRGGSQWPGKDSREDRNNYAEI